MRVLEGLHELLVELQQLKGGDVRDDEMVVITDSSDAEDGVTILPEWCSAEMKPLLSFSLLYLM